MPAIDVDPRTAYQEVAPNGRWKAILLKVVPDSRAEDSPRLENFFHPGDKTLKWHFRFDDPELPEECNGALHVEETNTEPHRAGKTVKFCKGLGYPDPRDLDTDAITDWPVQVRTKQRASDDGRVFLSVAEVVPDD